MNRYKYLLLTPCHFTYEGKEYSLYYREIYELPECPFVLSLLAQDRVQLVERAKSFKK